MSDQLDAIKVRREKIIDKHPRFPVKVLVDIDWLLQEVDRLRLVVKDLRIEQDKAYGAGVKDAAKALYDGLDPDTRAMLV